MSGKSIKSALWIEDQFESFPIIQDVLEEAAEEVDIVTTAVDAKASLQRKRYDVVVADALLPRGGEKMDLNPYLGLVVLRQAPEPTRRIVVSFMAEEEVKRASEALEDMPTYVYFSKLSVGPQLERLVRSLKGEQGANSSSEPKV